MLAFYKKRYGFRLLLNEGKSFRHLTKIGKGERQIWEWVDDLIHHSPAKMDISLKQKLLKFSLDRDMAPALMLASAGSSFPVIARVPASWRSFLRVHGTRLHFMSEILWKVEIFRKFLDGIRCYQRLNKNKQLAPAGYYAVLLGLHGNTYTSAQKSITAQDFFAWFRKRFLWSRYWIVSESSQEYVSAGDCTWVSTSFPALTVKAQTKFQVAAQKIICAALVNLCVGRWHETYMLADRLEESYMQLVPLQDLAKMYVFTNATYIYRPLWTYEAERRGAEISLFFYSTNTFNMALANGCHNGIAPGYSLMSWPHIYTQHENHKKFLLNTMLYKADIHIVGHIPYEDNALDIDLPGQLKITYFDVQPFRVAFMASIGRPCHLYTEEVSRKAFEDLVSVADDMKANLFIKPKRNVGKRLSPGYRKMLLEAEQKKHIKRHWS